VGHGTGIVFLSHSTQFLLQTLLRIGQLRDAQSFIVQPGTIMQLKSVLFCGGAALTLSVAGPALAKKEPEAATTKAPVNLIPQQATPTPVQPAASAIVVPPLVPVAPPPVAAPTWSKADAVALLASIDAIGARGLIPADYDREALSAALAAGEGIPLNEAATKAFAKLIVDLRDGRTPGAARVQWFVRDPDAAAMPTDAVIGRALSSHDIEGALASLEPTHPDYAALKAMLATTKDPAKIAIIRTNLERWRWLPRDLGTRYVFVNVPEYMIRVVGKGKNISTYKAIVGAPKTATPQLSETAIGMIIHPTWTIPQSIIKESVGALIANNPAAARARGYRWTGKGAGLSVVQDFGPGNSLGAMKMDMPNPHAIFLHDTPSKGLFSRPVRALSHGCIRTDRATEFAILMSILQAGTDHREAAEIFKAGLNHRIAFTDPVQVYINYFTMASTGDGKLNSFADVYGRDAPVIASFAKPREDKKVVSPPVVVPIEAPGA
jgi:L,D-transpeptidase YcbB